MPDVQSLHIARPATSQIALSCDGEVFVQNGDVYVAASARLAMMNIVTDAIASASHQYFRCPLTVSAKNLGITPPCTPQQMRHLIARVQDIAKLVYPPNEAGRSDVESVLCMLGIHRPHIVETQMNRMTLVLNAMILVVTFVVALTAGDVQGELLTAGTRSLERGSRSRDTLITTGPTLLRVVQSMENFYPATKENSFSLEQLETIHEAIAVFYSGIDDGINGIRERRSEPGDVRQDLLLVGKSVRVDVESVLGRSFGDANLVRRLATEIIRNAH